MSAQMKSPLLLALVAHHAAETVQLLRTLLEQDGISVLSTCNGRIAHHHARQHRPDLLLLDEALPLKNGLELCRALRRESDVGNAPAIVILSDHPDASSKHLAFNSGADDYLALPMRPDDLLRRVWDVTRRARRVEGRGARPLVRCGEIELDQDQRRVRAAGRECALTTLEFELLSVFVHHPNRVFPREALLDQLSGFLRGDSMGRAVDIHISNLRRKLRQAQGAETAIETVRGVGYRLHAKTPATTTAARAGTEADLEHLALVALARTPMPLLVLAPDRTVLLYNEAAQCLCGWAVKEVAGQVKCYSLLSCHDEDGTLLCEERCAWRAALRAGSSELQMPYTITCKDGRQIPVMAHYRQLADTAPESEGVVLMLHAEDRRSGMDGAMEIDGA
jgi:DNA-binding response OmpR family regulator